ncbi:BTAD domain-containing putative transcriptional regulator [Streptomyces flaveolus]|uniref:BTAD domain-containing putative transcriptional regulator n=1 Tax=Streptomyces flaveolus TaxID=67297 RepID=UPI0033B99ED1
MHQGRQGLALTQHPSLSTSLERGDPHPRAATVWFAAKSRSTPGWTGFLPYPHAPTPAGIHGTRFGILARSRSAPTTALPSPPAAPAPRPAHAAAARRRPRGVREAPAGRSARRRAARRGHGRAQSRISRLRRRLAPHAGIDAVPAGHALAVDPDAVDAHRFARLAAEGRTALTAGGHPRAAALLRDALALWRGPTGPSWKAAAS